ncbi:sporulation factor SpoIIGA [Alicyclobacillus sacchari]|uniref:Sporulation factor SpoIIGA n=2 Tax=Alicyclobacillus sacchari TaxID=392010 RepID=A0A4R8LMQ8_9BACL|nr:sigma-E processing peptidase SpoIIGA [Alicyclobacillus sacchari]TDY46647.1 sporulation factor SpoIIGA [Alicyclobacillus sacchari]GMA58801.1 sporulation sigma-E factor-processing peptidase [Alicyclobacillus sacchari]
MQAVPVVYIDVVWIVNLVMDFVLLWTTGWLMKRRASLRRLALGALVGACYSLLLFFPTLALLTTWPGKALVSVLMVWIALPYKHLVDLARLLGAYYIVAFVFAGASIALGFTVPGVSLDKSLFTQHGLLFRTSGETFAMMVGVPLCLYTVRRLLIYLRKQARLQNFTALVEAEFDGVSLQFTGLFDSGNQLVDPVSKRPVSFVDMDVLLPVLPSELSEAVKAGEDLFAALATVATFHHIALVPYQGASGRGLTIALRPQVVHIVRGGTRTMVTEACLFAAFPGKLSADGSFQAILHMDLMNGVDEDEKIAITQRHESTAATPAATPVSAHSHSHTRSS